MAKKTAPKKKVGSAKPASKVTKKSAPAKVASKPAKPAAKAKSVAKATVAKPVKQAKAAAPVKPALMTKKGKSSPIEEVEEQKIVAKNQTVVSMLEADSGDEEPVKAEKVSKIKPVKIERGNASDEKAKWLELNKKYGKEKAVTYKMSEKFANMIPMQHKVLGWGFILTNENDRLEVLFETGIRMLISNYKS